MKVIQNIAIILIGILPVLSACARPATTTPPITTPPTTTPPITTPPITTPPTTTPPITTPPTTTPPTTTPPTTTPPTTTPPAIQGPYEIWIPGREFRPSILTVPAGTKVTWTNKDGEQHTVTSSKGLFGPSLAFEQSFSYTFNERGRFEYYCDPHPEMTAVVIVE